VDEQEILKEILAHRSAAMSPPSFCARLFAPRQRPASLATSVPGSRLHSSQASGTTSSAQMKYTPSNTTSNSGRTSASTTGFTGGVGANQSSARVIPSGSAFSQKTSSPAKPSWVVFGIGPGDWPRVDQIGNEDLATDLKFLKQLRSRHKQLRGRLLQFFDFYQLQTWDLVKARS
jgi:hypothetical protein